MIFLGERCTCFYTISTKFIFCCSKIKKKLFLKNNETADIPTLCETNKMTKMGKFKNLFKWKKLQIIKKASDGPNELLDKVREKEQHKNATTTSHEIKMVSEVNSCIDTNQQVQKLVA